MSQSNALQKRPLILSSIFIRKVLTLFIFLYGLGTSAVADTYATTALSKITTDLSDLNSLQRGAKLVINYCAGCHSLHYLRYNQMAKDIGLVDRKGQINKKLLMDNLIFTTAKPEDLITTALTPKQSISWFGIAAPDLSLVAKVRGTAWMYTYLTSFYRDPRRPFGSNNWLFPEVAMPNILAPLQGEQEPVYALNFRAYRGQLQEVKQIKALQLTTVGKMNEAQFKKAIQDIVNFLAYVADPNQLKRQSLGKWVILFLLILFIFAYCLKREYWKAIK